MFQVIKELLKEYNGDIIIAIGVSLFFLSLMALGYVVGHSSAKLDCEKEKTVAAVNSGKKAIQNAVDFKKVENDTNNINAGDLDNALSKLHILRQENDR